MVGVGDPVAVQGKVVVDDGAAVTLLGWDVNCGEVCAVCVQCSIKFNSYTHQISQSLV